MVWVPVIPRLFGLGFCRLAPIGLLLPISFSSVSRGVPDHIDADRDLVLDRDGQEGGCIDFEVGEGGGDHARDVMGGALDGLVELHVSVVCSIAGELDFEVAVERGRVEARLGQAKANLDDGELHAAGGLDHVQVAVAVAGIEGLDGCGDEEVTLTFVAYTFSTSSVTGAIDLVHRMRHVIGEGGLIEGPRLVGRLGVRGCESGQREQEDCEQALFHGTPKT